MGRRKKRKTRSRRVLLVFEAPNSTAGYIRGVVERCREQGVDIVTTNFSKQRAAARYGVPDDDYGLALYFYARCKNQGYTECILVARDRNVAEYAKLILLTLREPPEAIITIMRTTRFSMTVEDMASLVRLLASKLCPGTGSISG